MDARSEREWMQAMMLLLSARVDATLDSKAVRAAYRVVLGDAPRPHDHVAILAAVAQFGRGVRVYPRDYLCHLRTLIECENNLARCEAPEVDLNDFDATSHVAIALVPTHLSHLSPADVGGAHVAVKNDLAMVWWS